MPKISKYPQVSIQIHPKGGHGWQPIEIVDIQYKNQVYTISRTYIKGYELEFKAAFDQILSTFRFD